MSGEPRPHEFPTSAVFSHNEDFGMLLCTSVIGQTFAGYLLKVWNIRTLIQGLMLAVQCCLLVQNSLRVLCTVYTQYPNVMTKYNVNGHLVSLILFMQFNTCKFGIHGNKHAHIAIIHPKLELVCIQ